MKAIFVIILFSIFLLLLRTKGKINFFDELKSHYFEVFFSLALTVVTFIKFEIQELEITFIMVALLFFYSTSTMSTYIINKLKNLLLKK